MKKAMFIGLLIIAAISTNAQASMTVILQDHGNDAYTATVNGTQAVGKYLPGQTFKTFCLEMNEYYVAGWTYNVGISTAAINGGISGGNPDPLDSRTAFLYTNFMNGQTWGYSDNAFQDAIHYIEGETATSNGLVTIANAAIQSGGSWYGKGLGDVRVMNVWYRDGQNSQDQLVQVAVPTPGAILLGSIGIIIVGFIRRKIAI
jgi:hypothetical protein